MSTKPNKADPRQAHTLGEAALNDDGTWNGARALSWLSEILRPGNGIAEDDVKKMFDEAKQKKQR